MEDCSILAPDMEKDLLERLTYIKYMSDIAAAQSKIPSKLAAYSLLTFYDLVETMLLLIAEHRLDKHPGDIAVMSYWDDKYGLNLPGRSDIDKLRLHRKYLKHKGTLPHSDDILICREGALTFLRTVSFDFFRTKWEDISLSALIDDEAIKRYVLDAEKLIQRGNHEESIIQSALAFARISHRYLDLHSNIKSRSRYPFDYYSIYVPANPNDRSIRQIVEEIQKMRQYLQIQSSGIDMEKYRRFMQYTPIIIRSADDQYMPRGRFVLENDPIFSMAHSQFCLEFVIDCYLLFQSFDYEPVSFYTDIE